MKWHTPVTSNSSTQEAETGGPSRTEGQPGLYTARLSQVKGRKEGREGGAEEHR